MKNVFTSFSLLLFSTLTYAQSTPSPYTFSGNSCPSQGAWTQAALRQADQITSAIQQLKDNPACTGLIKAVVRLQSQTQEAFGSKSAGTDDKDQSQIEGFPTSMQALGSGVMEGGTLNSQTANTLMNTEIQAAGRTAELGLGQSLSSMRPTRVPLPSSALSAMFEKYKAPIAKGLDLATNIFNTLPQYDECLIGQPDAAMTMVSGAIKMAAAFSASGEGVGDRLGNAVAGLAKMMRDRKFTIALRKQHEVELWYSISCLLEATTKNYCDAANAQDILLYTKKQYQNSRSGNKAKDIQRAYLATVKQYNTDSLDPKYDNPLEGYYLLVRELPIIANWLQSVIFGAIPRLTTDATFKNGVLTDVTTLMQTNFNIAGTLSERLLYYKEQKTLETKRSVLYSIINDMISLMDPGTPAGKFYSATKLPQMLPFFLVGLDAIPKECTGPASVAMPWQDWMTKNPSTNGFATIFQNPDDLVEKFQVRMREVTSGAAEKASVYYRKRLIVDMENLVNQTISSQNITVYEAYQRVYFYLERFKKRLKKNGMDMVMLVSVQQTQDQINRFFDSYNELKKLGKKVMDANGSFKSLNPKEVHAAAEKVIGTAFDEFNILYQRDAFLTNRLSTFIERDFAIRVREGLNMSNDTRNLMIINQNHLLEKLIEVHGINPTDAETDLAQAQGINNRNLEAMENVFSDTLYRMVLSVRAVAEGKGESWLKEQLDRDAIKNAGATSRAFASALTITPYTFVLSPFTGWISGWIHKTRNPDLYSTKSLEGTGMKRDDKYGSMQRVVGKICAQSLAFENRSKFIEVCRGTSMKSWYGEKQLDFNYNDFVPDTFAKARAMAADSDYAGKNICAFNRFQIRNIVKYLNDQSRESFGQDQDSL